MIGIVSFIAFTAIVAIFAYLSTKGTDETTSDGYFLGGRSLGAVTIAGSLLLTNLSTEQLVGLNGGAYNHGILVMAWETFAAVAMIVTAVWLLPRYLKGGIATIPTFLSRRFDTMTKTLVSALFLSGYVVVLLPIVLYSGALAFITMFDLENLLGMDKTACLWVCVWVIGLIGSIYAIFGGLKAVAVSDLVNAVGLMIGGLLIPVFGLMAIGDGSMMNGLNTLTAAQPEMFNAIGSSTSDIPFSTIFTGMMLVQLFYWGTNQAIIQRALGASSLEEGQKGLVLASFIKILGPLIVVLPGIIAFHMFNGELLDGDEAYPSLVKEVLPAPLLGFFAAVIFGAIMSSFNSALNSSVTLFGLDIYKEHFNKEATGKQVVKAGKTFGIILAILAMCIAPFIANAPDGLFGYLQEVNGCYSIPILTIIVVGLLTKFVPAKAAKIALGLGVVLYCISQFGIKPYKVNQNLNTNKVEVVSLLNEFKESLNADKVEILSLESEFKESLIGSEFEGGVYTNLMTSINNLTSASTVNSGLTKDIGKRFKTLRKLYLKSDRKMKETLKETNSAYAGKVGDITVKSYPHFLHVMAILFLFNVIIMLIIGKVSPRIEAYEQKYTEDVDIAPWKLVKPIGAVICLIVVGVYFYFS